jgi:hypothetical protein
MRANLPRVQCVSNAASMLFDMLKLKLCHVCLDAVSTRSDGRCDECSGIDTSTIQRTSGEDLLEIVRASWEQSESADTLRDRERDERIRESVRRKRETTAALAEQRQQRRRANSSKHQLAFAAVDATHKIS